MDKSPISKLDEVKEALSHEEGNWEDIFDDNKFYDGVYLFFSFDLVNSTEFKSKHNGEWKSVFTRFYELVSSQMSYYHPKSLIWKYVGDEILFYLKVNNFEDIYKSPVNSLNIIRNVTNTLNKDYQISKNVLFIKGTLWVANVRYYDGRNMDDSVKNIAFLAGNIPIWLDHQRIDFLGPDIDLGFRLANFTRKNQLLISAELAYLLHRKNGDISSHSRPVEYRFKVDETCKLIKLEHLKGIWNNRRYPIIWFNTKWEFEYDEDLDSELVRIIKEKDELKFNEYFPKIFEDLDKVDELENMIKFIESLKNKDESPLIKYDIPQERLAEVHCAAICFDNEGKLMIAKRPQTKKRLQGKWEFGCGQLEVNQNIQECLIENYKNDFHADLDFIDEKPIPITTYTIYIEEEQRRVPGILFLSVIKNPEEVMKNFDRTKHDEVKFIDIEELKKIPESDVVEDLHKSAEMAYEVFVSIKNTIQEKI